MAICTDGPRERLLIRHLSKSTLEEWDLCQVKQLTAFESDGIFYVAWVPYDGLLTTSAADRIYAYDVYEGIQHEMPIQGTIQHLTVWKRRVYFTLWSHSTVICFDMDTKELDNNYMKLTHQHTLVAPVVVCYG